MNTPKCNRLTYILLAIFVGWLGVHNFVAGYTKKGVFQLILGTVGMLLMGIGPMVSALWAIFEAITVKEDANGVSFDGGESSSNAPSSHSTSSNSDSDEFSKAA